MKGCDDGVSLTKEVKEGVKEDISSFPPLMKLTSFLHNQTVYLTSSTKSLDNSVNGFSVCWLDS